MAERIANMSSWMVYVLLFAVTFIAANILLWLRNAFQKAPAGASANRAGRRISPAKFMLMLLLFLSIAVVVFFSAFLRSFSAFTSKELVAAVICEPTIEKDADFNLVFIKIVDGKKQQAQNFAIKGDQWAVSGDILKWKDYMNFMGLKTMYRLARVEGRYELARDAQKKAASAYPLGDESKGLLWGFLYKFSHRLPMVTSVYGNSVFLNPVFDQRFNIYVTTSGFMTERVGDQADMKNK
jgi:hypothetical protein